jgi:hypothetical protein
MHQVIIVFYNNLSSYTLRYVDESSEIYYSSIIHGEVFVVC